MRPKSIVAKRIQQLRNDMQLTQGDFSRSIGIPLDTIVSYEVSRREPQGRHLAKLEQFFGVSGPYIMGLTDDRGGKEEAQPQPTTNTDKTKQDEPTPASYQMALDTGTSDENYIGIIVRCASCNRIILTSTYAAGVVITHDLPRYCPHCGK